MAEPDERIQMESSAEALVSLKEGKGNNFHATLSPGKRDHPVRVRKPNKYFFGDNDVGTPHTPRPRKQARPTQITRGALHYQPERLDKNKIQETGKRLRNLLKLPKAHKWVCYEWFYSNIDIPLFHGENDFCTCLSESFPQLKTRKLRRVEWCKIRRLMGKPRRCSSAFFTEERASLQKKREKIRMLQQSKSSEVVDLKDLPEEVPMPLVLGTKVTARVRNPQDGLFTGTIDAVDTVNNTYRVKFDRPGLGVHSIPDTEVLSNDVQETMPLTSFQTKHHPSRPNFYSPPCFVAGIGSPELDNDPLLGASPLRGKVFTEDDGSYGGFPIKFLALVMKLSKILSDKKDLISRLKDMNTQAEKMKSYGTAYPIHFQQEYAALVLELEQLNKQLDESLTGVQEFSQELAPEQGIGKMDLPSDIKRKCEEEAKKMVTRSNTAHGKSMVRSERTVELIINLTALMLQIKTFAENDYTSFEFKSLQDTLKDIKGLIDPSNISVFENNVEIHMNHIQSGLSQMGNLHAFSSSAVNST